MASNLSRRTFLGLAGGAAGALLLSGCSNEQSSNSEAASTTGGVEGGGTITVGLAEAADGFNPQTTISPTAVSANWQVVEGLYGLDHHTYEPFDELAAGDPIQIDETTYEITLRSGAQFSDGTEVTPNDVAHAFSLATAGGSVLAVPLAPIASLVQKDATTLTVTTTVANFSLLKQRLSVLRVTPAIQPVAAMTKRPLGSGPWAYDSIGDSSIELVPNTHYNGAHPASDAKIHHDVTPDASARSAAQREGTTLVMESVTPGTLAELEQAGCSIDTAQGLGAYFLMFNVKNTPWDSQLVRQAVMYAIDADRIVEEVFSGLATPATSFLPRGLASYHQAATVYTHDANLAQELLAQAECTPGDLVLRCTDGEQVQAVAARIQDDLSAIGFQVSVKSDTARATYNAIDGGEAYDILLDFGDPSCLGSDADLLVGWWYASDLWMGTRCPWNDSAEYQQLRDLMSEALAQSGDEQQQTWNQCFDLLAASAVLYPVLHASSVTASWRDAPNANGTKVKNFYGIGAPGLSFLDVTTVSA